MIHTYRSAALTPPQERNPRTLWQRFTDRVSMVSEWQWYRRLRGGRWAQFAVRPPVYLDDGAVLVAELWERTPVCPGETGTFSDAEIAAVDGFERDIRVQTNYVVESHRERCTCEVWS